MIPYNLDLTLTKLKGPTKEQVIANNQWAITALELYHSDSKANFEFQIDGVQFSSRIIWEKGFSKAAMKEKKDMAHYGGVALAMFVMSVLLDYSYVEQTEIGDGVDYNFMKKEPDDEDLNFLSNGHYIEVSGILEENSHNSLSSRLKGKYYQVKKGSKRDESSSVIVTVFKHPKTVKVLNL